MSIELIIADDHAVVRDGIRAVIEKKAQEIKIIGEASNGKDVLNIARNHPADVYVLDIAMPILNGIETAQRLLKMDPKSKIIILSMHDNRTFVYKAMEAGAKGYILKESAIEEVLEAIRQVYMGRCFLSPKISNFVVQGFLGKINPKRYERQTALSPREREVLQLISEGLSNKEISTRLNLSLNTVHVHRNNIMRKLDIHRQAELIRHALKEGISQL